MSETAVVEGAIEIADIKMVGRTVEDEAELKGLAGSITRDGLIEPIVLRRVNGTLELIAGARRLGAMKLAGLTAVPPEWMIVRENVSDEAAATMRLAENLWRLNLHPIDEVRLYEAMLQLGMTAEDVAKKAGKPLRYVQRTLVLGALSDQAREAFKKGKITHGMAYQIARLPNPDHQAQALQFSLKGERGVAPGWKPDAQDLARWIQRNILLRLADAPFDTKIELNGVGPCGACPKRSGNQPVLFDKEEELGADTCLDRACFDGKAKAAAAARVELLRAEGKEVLDVKQAVAWEKKAITAKKLTTGAVSLERSYAYRGQSFVQALGPKHKEHCLNACPDFAYVQGDNGQVVKTCFNVKCLNTLLKERQRELAKDTRGTADGGSAAASDRRRPEALAKKIRAAVDQWLQERVPPALASSSNAKAPAMLDRLSLLVACKQWSARHGDAEERTTIKKQVGFDPMMAYGDEAVMWRKIMTLPDKKVGEALRALLVTMAPSWDAVILHDVGLAVGVDPFKQLQLSAGHVALYQRAEFRALCKELNIAWRDASGSQGGPGMGSEVDLDGKKDEIVTELAKRMKAGKLPRQWIRVIEKK